MKKFLILMGIALISVAAVFAQSTADELAKWKDLLDSGAITQEEYDAKKAQILDGGAQSQQTQTLNVSNEDLVATIENLIEDDLEDNKEKIASLATRLSSEQKQELYDKYQKSAGGYFALNLLLGFGIGSFAQGDKRSAWTQLGFELGGITCIALGSSSGSAYATAIGAGFCIGAGIVGLVAPWTYAANRNEALAESLGVESISWMPMVDPTNESVGLVARINF